MLKTVGIQLAYSFFTVIVIVMVFQTTPVKCKRREMMAGRLENVTQTISKILKGYDIRLRPNFGADPLHVGMDLDNSKL
ncbi:hypothetical protein DOY81_004655 [Sarcophaga bullata]|nr:hypothetical protein DOY81_004655 [Sarcophaga bullata]